MAIILDGTDGVTAPGTETFGDGTALGGATNPIVSMARAANNYVQSYIVNNTNGTSASADFVAYPANGNDAHGWVDMGITAEVYADATYTVTGPNEAYLFGSAPSGSGATGNLVIATDNTGTANSIQFYTGGFTQAKSAAKMTINGSGAIAYGTSYGTSGQVLTSNGSAAAPTWNTLTVSGTGGSTASGNVTLTSASSGAQSITTTAYGQTVTLPSATTMTKAACVFAIQNAGSYPLKVLNNASGVLGFIPAGSSSIIGLADNSTAAGTWTADGLDPIAITAEYVNTTLTSAQISPTYSSTIAIDSNRILVLSAYRGTGGSGSQNLYGIVYDQSSQTWGSLTVIRSGAAYLCSSLLVSSNTILVASCGASTALQAVILSISGTTITVNTAATATLTTNASGSFTLTTVGTSYILAYARNAPTTGVRALTVSGTTVTIGAESALSGSANETFALNVYAISASAFITFSSVTGASGTIYAKPFTVSGSTLTAGTQVTLTATSSVAYRVTPISSGARWAVFYLNTTNISASIISVAANVATASTVTLITSSGTDAGYATDLLVSGNKVVFIAPQSSSSYPLVNILTDTSGTASAGTVLALNSGYTTTAGYTTAILTSGTTAAFTFASNSGGFFYKVNISFSGASATLLSTSGMGVSSPIGGFAASLPYSSEVNSQRSAYTMKNTNTVYAFTNAQYVTAPYMAVGVSKMKVGYVSTAPEIQPTCIGPNDNEIWCTNYSVGASAGWMLQRVECATI